MRSLIDDFRHAMRALKRRPGLSLLAVITLAIGMGAASTVFTVLNFSLLQNISAPHAGELVSIYSGTPEFPYSWTPYADYVDYRDQNDTLSGLSARSPLNVTLDLQGQSERVSGEIVSGNYFQVLQLRAVEGRLFVPEDDRAGAERLVVLSHSFWQEHFGGQISALGAGMKINGQAFHVIGVAPATFSAVDLGFTPAFWVTMSSQDAVKPATRDWMHDRKLAWTLLLGRLKRGESLEQSQSNLRSVTGLIDRAYPLPDHKRLVSVTPAMPLHAALRNETWSTFRLFLAAVFVVLIIACSNVSNLMLSQAAARSRETGISLALGASRIRIVRQYLLQSCILAGAGTLAGFSFNSIGRRLILAYFEQAGPGNSYPEIHFDYRIFGFCVLMTLLCAALFGIVPALQASKPDPAGLLKDQPAADNRAGILGMGFRNFLVVAQISMSLVLLIAAGLLLRTLWNLRAVSPGFDQRSVLLASLSIDPQRYSPEEGSRFLQSFTERIAGLPGVKAVATAPVLPLEPNFQNRETWIPGEPGRTFNLDSAAVGRDYFNTLQIAVPQGRAFGSDDAGRSPEPVVINRTFADRLWPAETAVGRRLMTGNPLERDSWKELEVVGISENSKYSSLSEPDLPFLYVLVDNDFNFRTHLVIRTGGNPLALAQPLRQLLREVEPNLAIGQIWTLEDHLVRSQWQQRLYADMIGLLGLIALTLASVGVFSVTHYRFRRQVHNIGIRIALGARSSDVFKLVWLQTMRWAFLGIVSGLVGAFFLTRILRSSLFRVGTMDPATYIGVALLLSFIALLAASLPARKATRVDPMVCLRHS